MQARENIQPEPSAGKRVTSVKRGKTYNPRQARENMQPVPSAGKPVTCAKRGKTRLSQVMIGFGFAPDWLIK